MNPNYTLNSYDAYKCTALLFMLIDHAGYYLVSDEEIWRMIGRLAMPIFAFLVGYNGQYRYSRHLFWVAVWVSFAEGARGEYYGQSILWGILLSRWLLSIKSPELWVNKAPWVIFGCVVWFPITNVFIEYGTLTLLWALLGHVVRVHPQRIGVATAYAASALTLTLFMTWDSFVVHDFAGIGATIALAWLTWNLLNFENKPWAITGARAWCVNTLSRNTLTYYGVHVLVLAAIGLMLGIKP